MLEGELVETLDADHNGTFGQAVFDAAGSGEQGLGGGGARGGKAEYVGAAQTGFQVACNFTQGVVFFFGAGSRRGFAVGHHIGSGADEHGNTGQVVCLPAGRGVGLADLSLNPAAQLRQRGRSGGEGGEIRQLSRLPQAVCGTEGRRQE